LFQIRLSSIHGLIRNTFPLFGWRPEGKGYDLMMITMTNDYLIKRMFLSVNYFVRAISKKARKGKGLVIIEDETQKVK